MFIELIDPEVVDRQLCKDRIGLRVREPGANFKYWLTVSFKGGGDEGQKKMVEFLEKALEKVKAERPRPNF